MCCCVGRWKRLAVFGDGVREVVLRSVNGLLTAFADDNLADKHHDGREEDNCETDLECHQRVSAGGVFEEVGKTVDYERSEYVTGRVHDCEDGHGESKGESGGDYRQAVVVVRLGYAIEVGGDENADSDHYSHVADYHEEEADEYGE